MEGIEESDFERQFKRASLLVLDGKDGKPESTTSVKVTEVLPSHSKNERVVAFAQAFAHPLKTYEPALKQLYKDGRSTLTFDHPRAGGELPELSAEELEAVKDFVAAPEEIRAAKLFLSVLESKNALQADVMTHSRGIGYTAIAALIDDVRSKKEGRENRIRNIVAYGPVGLIGDDSFGPLVGRVLAETQARPDWGSEHQSIEQVALEVATDRRKAVRSGELPRDTTLEYEKVLEELKAKKASAEARGIIEYGPPDAEGMALAKEMAARGAAEGAKHVFGALDAVTEGGASLLSLAAKGVGRTLREGRGLATVQLQEVLPRLREIGIGIAVVRGDNDRVFPAERIATYMKTLREYGILDVQMTGVHDTIVQDPRAAYILEKLFDELEKQRTATVDTSDE